jgi:hypothetical protein
MATRRMGAAANAAAASFTTSGCFQLQIADFGLFGPAAAMQDARLLA